jgi:hypothetical protein
MRAILLKGTDINDILLTFHHVIGDGTSSIYLIRDFLDVLGKVTMIKAQYSRCRNVPPWKTYSLILHVVSKD